MDEKRLCIFGSGFQVTPLSICEWLSSVPVFYFGDLNEHGFNILSQFRNCFSHARSFCMDMQTLREFDQYRTRGSSIAEDVLLNLTEDERQVFSCLKNNQEHNRLEQERIPLFYVIKCLKEL